MLFMTLLRFYKSHTKKPPTQQLYKDANYHSCVRRHDSCDKKLLKVNYYIIIPGAC